MANLGYTNTPLIAHLYDTSEAALIAASELGCNGYRTYNINGQNKYVPCSSFMAYERAIKLYKIQGVENPVSGDGTLGDKAVGLQFASTKDEIGGNPYFTLGNFSISSSVTKKDASDGRVVDLVGDENGKTAASINENNPSKNDQSTAIEQVNKKIEDNVTVKVLFDRKKLENYVSYSPLKDTIKNTIIEITQSYPAALRLNVIGLQSPTISEYSYSDKTDTAQLKLNLANISNPFELEYTSTGTTINDPVNVNPIRNFSKNYRDYTIYYKGIEYPIINATLPDSYTDNDTGIYLTIEGDPFSTEVNTDLTVNRTFWVKPKYQKYDEFQSGLSDMGKFLLDYNYDKKEYISTIRYSKVDDNGVELNVNETLIFPKIDDVNLDLFSNKFDLYLTKLNNISDDFDSTKTNLISRFLTTDSLKEFDTEDRRLDILLNLMGKNLDNVRKYIDGITYMTRLSYDKIENIPDLLTKNYGNMLGFETYNVEDESTIMESIFNLEDLNVEPGLTPAEIDIELWRRIFINSYHLWKSKGTRKSIEFILNLVGLPDSIFEVNEHVYVAREKLNFNNKAREIYGYQYSDENLLKLLPMDIDGYPTVPSQVQYQESGFNLNLDNRNRGPYDFGNAYIKGYEYEGKTPLFKLDRTTDNVKSWVYSENKVLRLSEDSVGYTEYYEDDSRLVINSKELEVYLSSDKIFDFTLYRFLNRNNINVNEDLIFPQDKTVNARELSFNQFMQKCLDDFINVSNRKTIKSYPTLTKIYYDYIKLTGTPVTNTKSLDFLNKFDGSWVKLVQQFTPATTILNAGKKIENSKLFDNKYVYKHGLNNDLDWLGNDGSEFQNKAKRPVNTGLTNPFDTSGLTKNAIVGDTPTFNVKGVKGKNYIGYDPSINEYFGFYLGIQDACNTQVEVYEWDGTKNYGDDSIYGGNINVSGDTKGIFVKHDGSLFRLNTNRMFTGILPTINTKVVHTENYIHLDNTNPIEVITLPNGPGEYIVEFTYNNLDTLKIYDGQTFGVPNLLLDTVTQDSGIEKGGVFKYYKYLNFTTSELVISRESNLNLSTEITRLNVELKHGTPVNFTVNGELVYQLITYGVDANEVLFYDSPITINNDERNYYIEGISVGHSTIATESNYICPVPEPHVCYFDYSGNTINMSALGYTTTNYATYLDETDKELSVRQPMNYGYSKDTSTTEPEDAISGSSGDWVIPFRKDNNWLSGEIYYKNDIVKFSGTYYEVEDPVVTGTTTTPTGTTTTTIVPGMYETFMNRSKTDPYMHIKPALIGKKNIDALNDIVSFNLTKDLYLYQVFSGSTNNETYKVVDNILNDELYISDSSTIEFDGFYSIDDTKVGPFYLANDEEITTQTLEEEISLTPDKINFINIKSLNTNFDSDNDKIGLAEGFYLVKRNSYLKFDSYLYFESDQTTTQNIVIRLQDQFDNLIHEQVFSFNGSDEAQDRVVNVSHESLFSVDTKIYLTIEPELVGCKLSRYEKIEIDYNEPTTYSAINDPRFRVTFNGGRTLIEGHYVDDVLSIEPVGDDNNYDVDHYMFKIDDISNKHNFKTKLKTTFNYDETNDFGLIFGKFFNKYKSTSDIGDVTVYEKNLNNDKFNFEVKVRSKNIGTFSGPKYSSPGIDFEDTVISNNNYLGNTPQEIENTGLSKSIIFGKTPKPKTIKLKKTNSQFLSSYLNGNVLSATPSTIDFIGKDEGFADYDLIDFSDNLKSSFLSKARYENATGYWKKENRIYATELYQDILSVVPEFSPNINNYEINDIVKVILPNTDVVVELEDTTIENRNVERLYVCIEDITFSHLTKEYSVSSTTPLTIHPFYRPNGPRASFIPIEKYDTKHFTPIGYDKYERKGIIKTNQKSYTHENPKLLTGSITDTLDLGDVVKVVGTGSTYNLYKYVYNKPLIYESGKSYKVGSYVYHQTSGTTNGAKFWLKVSEPDHEPGATSTTPSWVELSNDYIDHKVTFTNQVFNQYNYDRIETSSFTGTSSIPDSNWSTLNISGGSSLRIPNLIPTSQTFLLGYLMTNPRGKNTLFSDMVPNNINDDDSILDVVDNVGDLMFATMSVSSIYSGTTKSVYSGYTKNTNLIQNDYTDLTSNNLTFVTLSEERSDRNISPLFEFLCDEIEDNSIYEHDATGTTYNPTSQYNRDKYAVDRGLLYKTKSTGVLANNPHSDTTNWEERDFMVVKKYTLYKDRTSIKIYDGNISSLDEVTKNNLYFFDSNLILKDDFKSDSFNGSTHDTKLINGLNKLDEAKDTNIRDSFAYGLTGFRKSGGDLIMDYYYERDDNDLPKTGEFLGGLTIKNPCGHNAKVIFGTLFQFDENQVDDIFNRLQSALPTPKILSADEGKSVRLLINQNGASNVTLNITDNNGTTTTKNLQSNSSVDDVVVVEVNGELNISVQYDTFKNSTRYKEGFLDEYVLFNDIDEGIENTFVKANKTSIGNIETRVITVRDIQEDRVVRLDFEGANFIELGTVDPKDYIVL